MDFYHELVNRKPKKKFISGHSTACQRLLYIFHISPTESAFVCILEGKKSVMVVSEIVVLCCFVKSLKILFDCGCFFLISVSIKKRVENWKKVLKIWAEVFFFN